jgi:hypothetical protein
VQEVIEVKVPLDEQSYTPSTTHTPLDITIHLDNTGEMTPHSRGAVDMDDSVVIVPAKNKVRRCMCVV